MASVLQYVESDGCRRVPCGKDRRLFGTTLERPVRFGGSRAGRSQDFPVEVDMASMNNYRRLENGRSHRMGGHSLDLLVLDADFVALEENWTQPLPVETLSEGDLQQWFLSLSADDAKGH